MILLKKRLLKEKKISYKNAKKLFLYGLNRSTHGICAQVVDVIGDENYPEFIELLKLEGLVRLQPRSKNPLDVDVYLAETK